MASLACCGCGSEGRVGRPDLFMRGFCLPVWVAVGARSSVAPGLCDCVRPRASSSPPPDLAWVAPLGFTPSLSSGRFWGAGRMENVHTDPTAVKGERLQWFGAASSGEDGVGRSPAAAQLTRP